MALDKRIKLELRKLLVQEAKWLDLRSKDKSILEDLRKRDFWARMSKLLVRDQRPEERRVLYESIVEDKRSRMTPEVFEKWHRLLAPRLRKDYGIEE